MNKQYIFIFLFILVFLMSLTLWSTKNDMGRNLALVITGVLEDQQQCLSSLEKQENLLIAINDVRITATRLNTDTKKDYIIEKTSAENCGSAGCIFELCVIQNNGAQIIPFGYAAKKLVVKESITNGMHDIELQGNTNITLQWDTSRYQILSGY